jgi:hypothetical protein
MIGCPRHRADGTDSDDIGDPAVSVRGGTFSAGDHTQQWDGLDLVGVGRPVRPQHVVLERGIGD